MITIYIEDPIEVDSGSYHRLGCWVFLAKIAAVISCLLFLRESPP